MLGSRASFPSSLLRRLTAGCLFVALACGLSARAAVPDTPAAAAEPRATPASDAASDPAIQKQARVLRHAAAAMVGVRAVATPQAHSTDTLGPVRMGSGVVIDKDGTVLTIGYLIMEAERVDLETGTGKVVPARVVAYDLATGFGLLKPLVPMGVEPAPLGASGAVDETEPHVIVSGGSEAEMSLAQVVARRPFSGYWEYHIEDALFTVPPRVDHSGAGLFNRRGELVGIGSLIVMEAASPGVPEPGNMFVPVDLLKPVLAELRTRGASARSTRAWLGVNCIEQQGLVRVVRVSADSPAEQAGVEPGDLILKLDGLPINSLEAFYKKLWDHAQAEREVTLEIGRGASVQSKTAHTVDRMKTLRRAVGI
ncbi:S1C family serine protease [Aquabacterium sp. A7-Y]|uniref:S1C family serine protease n=1 Tax=Aquabacterium sp. A7-Y TaxID=1349605 RepID=UPI00223E758A|nr:S1C family serine protease [Aquabacterium sp. A7-Y]MCW7536343.1 S1C family serine protease [Aquabacterium sp. A7-Y]